jgi:hypothetical protein
MKTTISRILVVFLLLSTVFTMAAAPAGKTPHKDYFSSYGEAQQVISPGESRVEDGRFIFKHLILLTCFLEAADPRVGGCSNDDISGNFDLATGYGPFHITGRLVNGGGEWTLHVTGEITATGAYNHAEGVGAGGYQGMTLHEECWGSTSQAFCTGYIVDTH